MKKKYLFLSLILVVALLCSFAVANPAVTNKKVCADSIRPSYGQNIIVVGKGEVEVEPDTVKISFCINHRDESLLSGQTKIRENINAVINKIKEKNSDAEVYANYMSSYPVFENGKLAYQFDCHIIAKSSDVENYNQLIDTIIDAGATNINNTSFLLENKEDAYIKALVSAKENAENKIKAIYDNAKLVGLKEEATYNYCEGSRGEKIKVSAKVNAFYKVNTSELENNSNNGETDEITEVSTANKSSDKKTENNLTSKKQSGLEMQSVPKQTKALKTSEDTAIENKTDSEIRTLEDNTQNSKLTNSETIKQSGVEANIINPVEVTNANIEDLSKLDSDVVNSTNSESANLSNAENSQITDNKKESKDNSALEQETEKNSTTSEQEKLNEKTQNATEQENSSKVAQESINSSKTLNNKTKSSELRKTNTNRANLNKSNKNARQTTETRKIVDANGNVVIELL